MGLTVAMDKIKEPNMSAETDNITVRQTDQTTASQGDCSQKTAQHVRYYLIRFRRSDAFPVHSKPDLR